MSCKNQSGRSLLELLAVLAIAGFIALSSVYLFNTLFKYHQRRETVKTMDTLVTRFRGETLLRSKNGKIVLKDLMPEANTHENTLTTSDQGTMTLTAPPNGMTFVVTTKSLGLSCLDILQEGNYTGVAAGSDDTIPDSVTLYTADELKNKQWGNLCDEKYQYFVYNKEDTDACPYYINGECSECPKSGEVKGKDGLCCQQETYDKNCGYCKEECGGNGHCNAGSCNECVTEADCNGKLCVNGECHDCDKPGENCGKGENCWCTENYECECCDTNFRNWNGYTCTCKGERPDLGESCEQTAPNGKPLCGCSENLICSSGICLLAGNEACANDPKNVAQGKLCLEDGVCTCCAPAQFSNVENKCLDCSKNTNGKTRFINGVCECQENFVFSAEKGKCIPDPTKCPATLLDKGASCAGGLSICCGDALSCKNGVCQCGTLPEKKNQECNESCGCLNLFVCTNGKCDCPATLPSKGQACNSECGCASGLECRDNMCVCPSKPANAAEACFEGCENACANGMPCVNGKCCPDPTGTSCVADRYYQQYPQCIQKTKVDCTDPGKPVCNPKSEICVQCMENKDCPENQYCTGNNTCAPCGPDGTAIRLQGEESCHCPDGTTLYCGSTSSSSNTKCKNGNYVCKSGCQQSSDCPTNEYCEKVGTAELGKCTPCPANTFRSAGGTECIGCLICEKVNAAGTACEPTCPNTQVCLMGGCTAKTQNGECSVVPMNATEMCVNKPDLIEIKGTINDKTYYLPPAADTFKMPQSDAARFCESYGLHLATIQEACTKDFKYDSGHDCPNITGGQTSGRSFTYAGKTYSLAAWNVTGMGSFWMDARYGSQCTSLTVTYSCGNNHEHNVCSEYFYPLCTK